MSETPSEQSPTLVVPAAELLRRTGVTSTPEALEAATDAILDAQADVEGYLHRLLTPSTHVATGLIPYVDGWRFDPVESPVLSIDSAVAERYVDTSLTGRFTVTYTAGLDAANDPALRPIRRYILVHAANSPAYTSMWAKATGAKGEVKSASTEGQSVSWAAATLGGGGAAGSGMPGALPTLASLAYWRASDIDVYQRPGARPNWPYGGSSWPS